MQVEIQKCSYGMRHAPPGSGLQSDRSWRTTCTFMHCRQIGAPANELPQWRLTAHPSRRTKTPDVPARLVTGLMLPNRANLAPDRTVGELLRHIRR